MEIEKLGAKLQVKINSKKKIAEDVFVTITISPKEKFEEILEKNIHFGLFIL
jgi:hypothetical protein